MSVGGRHRNIGRHYYRHLDKDSKVTVELDVPELVRRIVDMNYGVHRFLSELVDVRRQKLKELVERERKNGEERMARMIESDGDPLVEGIGDALDEGYF